MAETRTFEILSVSLTISKFLHAEFYHMRATVSTSCAILLTVQIVCAILLASEVSAVGETGNE